MWMGKNHILFVNQQFTPEKPNDVASVTVPASVAVPASVPASVLYSTDSAHTFKRSIRLEN